MAIKVTTPETKQEPKLFPKLMKFQDGSGGVFLFYDEKHCTCLKKGVSDVWKDFEYSEILNIGVFTDYNEPLTIQNA